MGLKDTRGANTFAHCAEEVVMSCLLTVDVGGNL